ncbi:MAG: 16S rRNA (guanine(527)-N(7))-methyltransferase RsmG [Mangrovibacterium sp.]
MPHQFLLNYFPNLSEKQINQFARMGDIYKEWNDKINVISRKDIDQLYERHILHSLGIAKITSFSPGTRIMDVGCGGGFPGIPLAIMFPEVEFLLIDAIAKKITVVNAVAQELGLTNVVARQQRAENVKSKFDFVVSRAVTAFPRFVSLVERKIQTTEQNNELQNGIIYLKGGDFLEEIESFKERTKIYDLSQFFTGEFFETKKVIHLAF